LPTMTLYYSLVFMLLVFEMTLFVSLIVPMPFRWRRKLFTFLSENPLVSKLQYWLKIVFVFVLILFVDSINRVYRVQVELSSAAAGNAGAAITVGSDRMEIQARKFYSQRNMYLCGFTLFLSLILNRTYVMILEVLRLEEENRRLNGGNTGSEKNSEKLANAGGSGEISKLRAELKKKDQDIETLKKQSEGLGKEYNKLGDQFTNSDGTPKKDR